MSRKKKENKELTAEGIAKGEEMRKNSRIMYEGPLGDGYIVYFQDRIYGLFGGDDLWGIEKHIEQFLEENALEGFKRDDFRIHEICGVLFRGDYEVYTDEEYVAQVLYEEYCGAPLIT